MIEALRVSRCGTSGPRCITLTINGKLDFKGNFHRTFDADWLWCLVAMVVTIESKVTINGKFYATGSRSWSYNHASGTVRTVWEICLRHCVFLSSHVGSA